MRLFLPIPVGLALLVMSLPLAADDDCRPQPVIDMHLHFYMPNTYWGPAPHPITGELGPATVKGHAAQTLAELKKNQVVLGLASAHTDWDNVDSERLWHSAAANHPERIAADSLAELVDAGHVKALGELGSQYAGISPADRRWQPLYELAERHDLAVGVHTGGGPPGIVRRSKPHFRYEYGNPLLLQDVLVQHPKLKVYMMHAGLAMYERETLAMMHMYPNLYVDIAVANWVAPFMIRAMERFLKEAIRRGYGERILFGSDQMVWPSAVTTAIDTIANADYLSDAQKRDILFDNAVTFLDLDESQRAELIERACP